MNATATLEGVDTVLRNLNAEIRKVEGVTRKGLIEAALIVLRQAQKNTPVDTGNLKASGSIVYGAEAPQEPEWKTVRTHKTLAATKGLTPKQRKALPKESLSAEQELLLAEGFADYVQEAMAEIQGDSKRSVESVIVGFSAFYSLFVHELHGTKGKYLESALREKAAEVLERIRRRAVVQ